MAEHYRFFDSKLGDERFYTADEFSEYFRTVLTNGIYNGGTNLQVYALGIDMSVQIQAGYAIINGYLYKVDEGEKTLTIEPADKDHDRIDRIVIRWDNREENRYIKAFVKKGVPAAEPLPPEITRNNEVYELSLAQITVKAARSVLQPELLVDERLNTAVCGVMNSRIQADTTEIFRQFNEWFNAKTPEFEEKFNDWLLSLRDKSSDEGLANHIIDTTKHIPFAAATNTGNAYKVQVEDVTSYVDGIGISFVASADSTGAVTLAVNNLAAVPIIKANGGAVNNLKANGVYTVRYNKGNFTLQGEGGEYGNVNQDQVLAGVTFGTENGLATGTIIHRSDEAFHQLSNGIAYMDSKALTKPPKGYYDGESWVYWTEPDIKPGNILSGKKIFDVQGNIPNYGRAVLGQGYKNAKSYRADHGGSLVVEPLRGYYEEGVNSNGFGSIIIRDPNFLHGNIVKGKSIFGISGSATPKSMGGYGAGDEIAIERLTFNGIPFEEVDILTNITDINTVIEDEKGRLLISCVTGSSSCILLYNKKTNAYGAQYWEKSPQQLRDTTAKYYGRFIAPPNSEYIYAILDGKGITKINKNTLVRDVFNFNILVRQVEDIVLYDNSTLVVAGNNSDFGQQLSLVKIRTSDLSVISRKDNLPSFNYSLRFVGNKYCYTMDNGTHYLINLSNFSTKVQASKNSLTEVKVNETTMYGIDSFLDGNYWYVMNRSSSAFPTAKYDVNTLNKIWETRETRKGIRDHDATYFKAFGHTQSAVPGTAVLVNKNTQQVVNLPYNATYEHNVMYDQYRDREITYDGRFSKLKIAHLKVKIK